MMMGVAMMQVRVVWVPVQYAGVLVPVGVRLTWRVGRAMPMLMMLVMPVPMLVRHRLVKVFMLVPFGQMQPQAKAHQCAGHSELRR